MFWDRGGDLEPLVRSLFMGVWRLANADRIRAAAERMMERVTEKRFQNLAVRYQRPCYDLLVWIFFLDA